jgi:hypothetical protein
LAGVSFAVLMISKNFKRRIVNGLKQDRAETQRDETIAGLNHRGRQGFVEQVKNELRFKA